MTTAIDASAQVALYPPTVTPPPAPLPLWRFLPTFLRNPLRSLPMTVYEQPIVAPPSMGGRFAWVTEPALVERILLESHEEFPKSPIEKRIFDALLGGGILTAEGAAWRWQRRTAAPIFRHSDLLTLVPAITEAAERAGNRWRQKSGPHRRAIDRDMTDVTFDALASTIFAGATEAEGDILKRHISGYLGWTTWDIVLEILRVPDHVWHPAKPMMRRHARALHATMQNVIDRERARGWPGGGLMAQLARATDPDTGAPMSDALLAHNLLTFAAAGHETTAKALSWTFYLLARSQEWQSAIFDEVIRVAGSDPIRAEHIDKLATTRMVIKEAMRLYPPAPIVGRMARSETDIGGHHFMPGAMLIMPIFAIHRHRALWSDPDRFDPTRFTPENERLHARTQFMPFGFGPRTCIGMSFAMIEAIVLLATLVRTAHVSWDGTHFPEPVARVTLRAKGGMPLVVRAR